MLDYQPPLLDMKFLLLEVFNAPKLWQSLGAEALDAEDIDAVLSEAGKIQAALFAPLMQSGDQGCRFDQGQVFTPTGFKQAYQQWAQGGWIGLAGNPDYQGQGMPKMLTLFVEEMMHSANTALALYPLLSAGAALLIDQHASADQKALWLPKLYAGQWAGTMCLTEPQCGTDLGLTRCKAEPQGDYYLLTGTKIFITGGEQDLTENILHLVLARLPDAPPGVKGISLFMVPKFEVDGQGQLGARNGVQCGSIEHKMGIKGSSTCVLNFDAARACLVGEPHAGLAQMFTMMNYERLSIGLQGLGLAERALQVALSYAQERRQSRHPGGPKEPQQEADSLIHIPDVRRMLLDIQTVVEGGRALAAYVGQWLDRAKAGDEMAQGRVALLTPVAKAWLTDQGFWACVQAQQVLGGHGYIQEWGLEQMVRDARIAQIYEGTNGIQALDLLARKVVANEGQWLDSWLAEARQEAQQSPAGARQLQTLAKVKEAARFVQQMGRDRAVLVNAVAVDFLALMGLAVVGQMWLRMQLVATTDSELHAHKRGLADYYAARWSAQDQGLLARILAGHHCITEPLLIF